MKKKIVYLLFVGFIGLSTGCEQEVDICDSIVGTWELQRLIIDEQEVSLVEKKQWIAFQANSIYLSYQSETNIQNRGGWSFSGQMLNISVDLPAAYYVIKVDEVSLTLKRLDFKSDSSLQTTIKEYKRVDEDAFYSN